MSKFKKWDIPDLFSFSDFAKELGTTDIEEKAAYEAFVAAQAGVDVDLLPHCWWYRGRPKQIMPDVPLDIFLILAGRGFGKTYAGSNNIIEGIESKGWKNIAIIGQNVRDTRNVMIKSKGGLLNQSLPWNPCEWKEQKGELVFENGAVCTCFSGDKPDQLRGPEHHAGWIDEPAKMQYPDDTMEQVLLGLRLGEMPQLIVTGTPRPINVIKSLIMDAEDPKEDSLRVFMVRGSTYENKANLSRNFIAAIKKKFEGTRMGDQEIHAKVLDDNQHALFQRAYFDRDRVERCPDDFVSIVVGVDPATTDKKTSDDTGIVAIGRRDEVDGNAHYYILRDRTQKMASPNVWAQAAIQLYEELHEEFPFVPIRIVGESNQGGQMVADTIHSRDDSISVELVHASKGKRARAEPISALHEQGRVHPVVNRTPELEDECTEWEPDVSPMSPNRLDALVWAIAKQSQEVKVWGFVRPATHQCGLKPVLKEIDRVWHFTYENGPERYYPGELARALWLSSTGQSAAVWVHIANNGWWTVIDSYQSKRAVPVRDFMSQVVKKSEGHRYRYNFVSGNRFHDPLQIDNNMRPTTLQQEIAQMDPTRPLFRQAGLIDGQKGLSTITAMLTARLAISEVGKNDPYWQVIGVDPIDYLGEASITIYPQDVLQAVRQAKYHPPTKDVNEKDIQEGLVNEGGPLIRCLRLLAVSHAADHLKQLG